MGGSQVGVELGQSPFRTQETAGMICFPCANNGVDAVGWLRNPFRTALQKPYELVPL